MVFITSLRAIALQSAKARIPSIKFRKGGLPASAQSSSKSGSQPGGKGQQATTIVSEELPARFKRPAFTQDEIDYINNGGPDKY